MNKIFSFFTFLNEPLFVYKKHWFCVTSLQMLKLLSFFTIFSSFSHFPRERATLLHIIVFFSFLQILIIIISFSCICTHYCCCCSISKSCPTFWDPMDAACQASLSFTVFLSLLKLMSIELTMPSNHLSQCHLLLFLPSILPRIKVFSNEPALCIRWSKYWSFNFSISPSCEYSGLISFRIDWFDRLAA